MARLVQFILFCGVAAMLVSWLARQTGMTVINWSGWQIELHTSLLLAGVVVLIIGLFCCIGLSGCWRYGQAG